MEINKKYELTILGKSSYYGRVYKIKALKDFGNVKKGDLGGWVESENNLSHDNLCWVYDDAVVAADARVYGNARVYDKAIVASDSKVYDDARVYGGAHIYGQAEIYGSARVCDFASVFGSVRVHGNSKLYGRVSVKGHITICGMAKVHGGGTIYGNSMIFGRANINVNKGYYSKIKNKCGEYPYWDLKIGSHFLMYFLINLIRDISKPKKKKFTLIYPPSLLEGRGLRYSKELNRIVALKDFGDVKKGDIGGWIENELNLSHKGDCWVYDEASISDLARLCDNAKITENVRLTSDAMVCGDAIVSGDGDVGGSEMIKSGITIAKVKFPGQIG